MKYTKVDNLSIGSKHNGYFIIKDGLEMQPLVFRDTHDYSLISVVDLEYGYTVESFLKYDLVLLNFRKPGFYLYHIESGKLDFIDSQILPQYEWSDEVVLCFDKEQKENAIRLHNIELFRYKYAYPQVARPCETGIMLFDCDAKENNWVSVLDHHTGKEKWRVDYHWHITRIEAHKQCIIFTYEAYDTIRTDEGFEGIRDWYNPDFFTIVLDGNTGTELWRQPYEYSHIDKENDVVLFGEYQLITDKGRVLECDLATGRVLTYVAPSAPADHGHKPDFVDQEGIYFRTEEGTFGKIRKTDGKVLWEFHLLDHKGAKRKIYNWCLLGNANLVLEGDRNHRNGGFVCVFNPNENLEYSKYYAT